MNQNPPSFERLFAKDPIANIATVQLHIVAQITWKFEVVTVNLRAKAVKNRNVVTSAQQSSGNARSDESGTTGDENTVFQTVPQSSLQYAR